MKSLANVLTGLVSAICFLVFVAVALAPVIFGISFNTILSGSMEPVLNTGGVVALEKVAFTQVQVGDVISFKVEGLDLPVCHRVIEIVQTEVGIGFRTKGDANEEPDSGVVKPEALSGRVIFHIPYLGYLATLVKTRLGFVLLIALPGALLTALEIKGLFWPKRTVVRRPQPQLRSKPNRTPAYLCLVTGLVAIVVLGVMMMGNTQERPLGSFARESQDPAQPRYVSERNMQNKGYFPLVICLFSEDSTVTVDEGYFRLSPRQEKTLKIGGEAKEAMIRSGAFFAFPLLPEGFLYDLFVWNARYAPLVVAAIPILPLTLIGFGLLWKFSYSAKPSLKERARYRRRLSYE